MGTLSKTNNHLYFSVKDQILYEHYTNARGKRVVAVMTVEGMEDIDIMTDEQVKELEAKYCTLDKQY